MDDFNSTQHHLISSSLEQRDFYQLRDLSKEFSLNKWLHTISLHNNFHCSWVTLLRDDSEADKQAIIIDGSGGVIALELLRVFPKLIVFLPFDYSQDSLSLYCRQRLLEFNVSVVSIDVSKALPIKGNMDYTLMVIQLSLCLQIQNNFKISNVNQIIQQFHTDLGSNGQLLLIDKNPIYKDSINCSSLKSILPSFLLLLSIKKYFSAKKIHSSKTYVSRSLLLKGVSERAVFISEESRDMSNGYYYSSWDKFKKLLYPKHFYSLLCRSYYILAKNINKDTSWISEFLIFFKHHLVLNSDLHLLRIITGNRSVSVLIIGTKDLPYNEYVVRIPNSLEGKERVKHNAKALKFIADNKVCDVAPELLYIGTYSSQFCTVESKVNGQFCSSSDNRLSKFENLTMLEYWLQQQNKLKKVYVIDELIFHELIGSMIQRIRSFCNDTEQCILTDIYKQLYDSLLGRECILSLCHGDLKNGNALFDGKSNILGLIDWDMMKERGFPLTDYFIFLIYQAVDTHNVSLEKAFEYLMENSIAEEYKFVISQAFYQFDCNECGIEICKIITFLEVFDRQMDIAAKTHDDYMKSIFIVFKKALFCLQKKCS